MALQATFVANFSDFDRAVKDASSNLNTFDFKVNGSQRALQQMTSSFDGSKIIREASLAAAAVEKIGGVSKLTEDEQRRLNDTIQKSIDKFAALGQSAPDDLRKIASEAANAVKSADDLKKGTDNAGGSLSSLGGIASGIGGVMAGAFAIGTITSFAKEVIELGGQIEDISKRTGMTTDAVQELGYAAKVTGSTFDNVQTASSKLSDKLVESSGATVRALSSVGLSLEDIRKSKPEDAFTRVADAIGEIPDPMLQTQLAMELFGKTGVELLPGMKEGFGDLRNEAHELGQVMSKDAVEGLAALGDGFDTVLGAAKTGVGELIADIAHLAKSLKDAIPTSAQTYKPPMGVTQDDIYGTGAGFAGALERARQAELDRKLTVQAPGMFAPAAPSFKFDTPDFEAQEKAAKAQMAAVEATLAHARAIKTQADSWRAADLSAQIRTQADSFATLSTAERANSDIAKKITEDYGKLRVHVGASGLPRDLENYYQAHLPVIRGTKELIDVTGRYATATLPDLSRHLQETRNMMAGLTADGLIPARDAFDKLTTHNLVEAPKGFDNVSAAIGRTKDATSEWARHTSGVLGDIRRDFSGYFADALTGQMTWKDAALGIWDSFKKGVTDILGSVLDYFINSFIKGITSALLGAQGGWGQAFAGAFSGGGGAGGVGGGGSWQQQLVNYGMGALLGGSTIGGTTSLAGVSGTASMAGGIGGGSFTGLGGSSSTSAIGTGGSFGGLALGAGLAGGAGLGLGYLGTKIFDGAGWKASGFGAGSGALAGAAIGSVVPGIGTGVGAGVGALAGLIGGWIGQTQGEKVNDTRDTFVAGAGGFAAISEELRKINDLGMDGNKIWHELFEADSFKELNLAVDHLKAAMESNAYQTLKVNEAYGTLQAQAAALSQAGLDQNAVLAQQAGDYSLLFDTIKQAGMDIPESMKGTFEALINLGLLVDENGVKVETLNAIYKDGGAAATASYAALDEQLMVLVASGDLNVAAADAMRQAFEAAGSDASGAMGMLGDKLDQLVDSGELTEEQAALLIKAFEEAGTTGEASFRDVISKVGDTKLTLADLVTAMGRTLPENVESGVDESVENFGRFGRALQDTIDRLPDRIIIPVDFQAGSAPSAPNNYDVPSFSDGGVINAGRGTLAMLHGREAIIPLDRMGGGGGRQDIHVHLEADGRELAHVIVPYTPSVLSFHGVAQ